MNRVRVALVVFALGAPALAAGGALTPAASAERAPSPCFEIIGPRRHAEPGSPILFNKCSGKTWLLVRDEGRQRYAYRWVSLAMDSAPASGAGAVGGAASHPGAAAAPAAAADPAGRKCFTFAGRKYCE